MMTNQHRRQRQADQDQRAHPDEFVAFALKEGRRVGMGQPVDDIAEELEERHFADRDQHGQHGHQAEPGGRRLGVVPAEGKETLRRNRQTRAPRLEKD
jgi:hypothetical protein